jgi:mycothiol synthase
MTGAGGHRELSWRLLGEPDLPALTELARECLSADGGQPFAASPGFLGRCYLSGAQTFAGFSGTRLACVSSLRLAPAVTTGLVAETEALGDGAHALYLSKGLSQVLAEDVMQVAALARPPPAHPPAGLTLAEWGQADPARFYAVYQAAFRDRPGFPGWTQARWVQWLTDDEDFRAEWTLLATLRGGRRRVHRRRSRRLDHADGRGAAGPGPRHRCPADR